MTQGTAGAGTGGASASASASLDFPPSPKASVCGFSLGLPRFKFGFKLVIPGFPPTLPFPFISLKLSCDLSNPVDITAGLKSPFGGGRTPNGEPDPDLTDSFP